MKKALWKKTNRSRKIRMIMIKESKRNSRRRSFDFSDAGKFFPRVSIRKNWLKPSLAAILIMILVSGLFYGNNQSLGYTYTFTQNDWTGGTSANNANHISNQNGWDEYASSSNLSVGANITLSNNNGSIAHTLNADFETGSEDTTDNTAVVGDSVQLAPLPTTGDGSDGALSVSGTFNINTQTNGNGGRACADGISYNVISLTDNTATLSGTPPGGCFVAGDQVMLINMQGDGAHLDNVGNYEFLEIQSASGSEITFTENKTKYYGNGLSDDTNIDAVAGDTWEAMAIAPTFFSTGSSFSYPGSGDYIYALRGGGSMSFWAYSISNNNWTTFDPTDAPGGISYGGSLLYPGSGDYIYALRGSGQTSFYAYSISNNNWTTFDPADAPDTVNYGGSLVYAGGDYIFATRGNSSSTFWAYSISNNNWTTFDPADAPGTFTYGGSLAYPGSGDYIYGMKGVNASFYAYSISNNNWTTFDPTDAPVSISQGGSMAYPGTGDFIYATQANNTSNFLAYSISNNNWTTFDPTNAPGNISTGGELYYPEFGDYIYAASVSTTNGFYRYHLPKQRVILQRIPQYTDVTISSGGSLTASDWDGSKGGLLTFLASGTVTVASGGIITMSGKGYWNGQNGIQGESYNKLGSNSTAANLGGGGNSGTGSGGGGYGTAGGNSTGTGGGTYGSTDLAKLFLGSGGGGQNNGNNGAGGGILYIGGNSISVSGAIADSGTAANDYTGGGSGGSVYLLGNSLSLGAGLATSSGGAGVLSGNGGDGRIHLKSSSISGTTSPTYVSSSLATEYYGAGTFVSSILDIGQKTSTWGNLAWNATLNGQTVSVKARTCDDAACSGEDVGKDWGSVCTSIASGNALSTGGCATAGDQYVQYQATLSTTDILVTPTLDDVSIGYSYYTASGSLISSVYDTTDAMNVMNKIVWDEGSLPSGTDVKFQIQTSPDNITWTGWEGPDGTGATYFTDETGGETMPANFMAGNDDKWFQYKAFLTSDGYATPTLSEVQVLYVVNASPEFQNVSAAQNASTGTVTVNYEVRDTDTETDTVNIALQYCTANCSAPGSEIWTDAVTVSGDAGTVGVTTAYQAKNLTWTPKTDFDGHYSAAQKIRLKADDGQPANALGYGETTFDLDTKNPTAIQITFDRSKSANQITIGATEDSTSGMQYALDFPNAAVDGSSDPCDFASPDWQNFTSPSQTVTVADNNDEVRKACVLFRDEYGNVSSNLSNFTLTPRTPYSFQYYDVSNVDIGDYRLFLSWGVPADTAEGKEGGSYGFSQYDIQRCSDLKDNPDCVPSATYETVVSKLENSLTDSESGSGLDPSLRYCYRYRIKDSNPDPSGDFSKWSDAICAVPGSGTSSITKNVSIHWYPTTEENAPSSQVYTTQATIRWQTVNAADPNEAILSDSTVWWRVQGSSEWTESYSVSSYVEDHAITIPGRLAPGTTYEYRVTSTSPWGASDTLDGTLPATFTTKLGPVIRNVQTVSVGNTNAAIEWDTEDQFGFPVNASSVLYYSVALDANGNLVSPQTANCSGGYSTHHVCTMADLTSGYHYYYYVYSILESDLDAFAADTNGGDFYRFTTTTDTTPPLITPDGGNPLILTDTQAALAFDTNERSESWLLFDTASHSGASFPSGNFDPDNLVHNPYADYIAGTSTTNLAHTFIFSLDSLEPETTYYYRFISEDVSGNARAGSESSFTTLKTQVDQHDSLSIISTPASANDDDSADITRGDTFAFVSWTTDQTANQSLACSETQGGPYTLTTSDLTHYNKSHTLKIISLSADTKYYCQASSVDDLAPASTLTSPEFSFTTLPDPEFQHGPLSDIYDVKNTLLTYKQAAIEFDTDEVALCQIYSGTTSNADDSFVTYENNVAKEDGYDFGSTFNEHHSVLITGLKPETKYYYRIECFDNLEPATLVASDDEYTFTTPKQEFTADEWGSQSDKIAPTISSVSVGSITGESVIVTWSTNEASNSLVTYSLDGSEISKIAGDYLDVANKTNYATSHSVVVNELIPSSKYTFAVISYDAAGNVGQSSTSTFTTKAPSELSSVKAAPRSLTEAVITWETGSETSSIVEYGLTTEYGEIKESSTKTKIHEIVISDLQAGQLYHFRVMGEDADGNMFDSNDNTFQQKSPPQLSGFAVSDITEKTAKIDFITNVPTDVLVTYTDLQDENNSGVQGIPTFSTKHSIELKNLVSGREFILKIRVRDEEGNELEEELSSFRTISDVNPPQIEQIKTDSALTQSDKVQTIISWITDEPSTSKLVYKEGMTGEEKEANVSSELTTKNSAVFTIFKPGTVYYFKVKSIDESKNETTSQEYALLTPRRRENIIQVIIANFEDIFRWTKK